MSVIKVDKLWEKYRIKFITEGRVSWEEVWALEDVSLSINKGEVIGIIGQNGAGKTTFLRLLAGMLVPDKGEITIEGKVSAIMELGAGFNPEFTGRENLVLNARSYGINDETLKQKINEIIEFSNLGKFIDAPIKCYSQGMYMRLAFALAVFAEPDILLIDDILAVGDEEAQQKCRKKIMELKKSGKTIILVSHDMSVISRLCDKVVFLDKGKIITKGLPPQVITYYLETAGEKSGIGILEQQGLRVVFNNGHLGIAYQGNYITGSVGGYCSFFDPALKLYFPSTNLSWKITSNSVSELKAEGRNREDHHYLQKFSIKLHNNILDLAIHNEGNLVNQYNFNLFLVSTYDEWILLDQQGCFPEFSHRINWVDLNLNVLPKQKLGIFTSIDNLLPGLIFESKFENNIIKFFNSGYEQESRILNLYSIDSKNLSLTIMACSQSVDFKERLEHERQILLLKHQEGEAKRLKEERLAQETAERSRKEQEDFYLNEHTITRDDCRLFVDETNRRVQIYYKDQKITTAGGVHSILPLTELVDLGFEIKKISEYQLVLNLHFNSFTQIWELVFQEGGVLSLKIKLETKKEIFLDKRNLLFELSNIYQDWQTPDEKGNLLNPQYVNEISPVRFKNSRVCSIALSSRQAAQVRIVFDIRTQNNYITGLYKRKIDNAEIICLNFQSIVPWIQRVVPVGRYDLFEARIVFNSPVRLKKDHVVDTAAAISRKNLKFIFNNGRGSIFWKDKELTFGLGVYTAVRSKNIWYDSSQAMWSLVEKDKQSAVILGKWPYIPISQLWEIKLSADNTIRWVISMEVHQAVEIEIEQTSMMLLDKYKEWSVKDMVKGKFIDEFTLDYDILPFRYWYGNASKKSLMVSEKGLPTIAFFNQKPYLMPRALIENSDYLYHSRLLQYLKLNKKLLPLKKRLYFSGMIKIGNK